MSVIILDEFTHKIIIDKNNILEFLMKIPNFHQQYKVSVKSIFISKDLTNRYNIQEIYFNLYGTDPNRTTIHVSSKNIHHPCTCSLNRYMFTKNEEGWNYMGGADSQYHPIYTPSSSPINYTFTLSYRDDKDNISLIQLIDDEQIILTLDFIGFFELGKY